MYRNFISLAASIGLALLTVHAQAQSSEIHNWWPAPVLMENDAHGRPDTLTALGPLFAQTEYEDVSVFSVRPLYTRFDFKNREASSTHLVYPFFNFYRYSESSHWHVLNLIRSAERLEGNERQVQVWPFLFWKDFPDDSRDAFALWPLGGTLKRFLGRERVDFAAWPLYIRTARRGEVRYSTPWPFIQTLTGEAEGFAFWPFFGHFERPGVYDHTFAVWPLYYDYHDRLDQPVPYHRFGVLPFYARETAAGMRSETYLWPFFGYTREQDPRPVYAETRYFYPFLVQGRGVEKSVNRWMPLYTHERVGDRQKWWYLWPFLKREEIDLGFLTRERTQFLFFLYRDEQQDAPGDFHARRQALWPLYSYWQDGHGRKQVQALDLFSVFFPRNRQVQETWTPLFAIYRYDERPGSTHRSFFWNLIVHERAGADKRLVVGPVFEQESSRNHSEWSILKGLLGRIETDNGTRWKVFWHTWGANRQ